MASAADRERSLGRGARARILEAAVGLFARQGYNATSVNDLHAAAHVSKRTLYQHFASKDELILAHLAVCERTSPVTAVLARADLAPRARLLEIFTAMSAGGPQPATPDPFIAAAVEFPDPDHPVHHAAADHRERFVARLAGLAREAGARDADRLGRRLALLYDGASCQAMIADATTVSADAYALATAIVRDELD